MTSPANSFKETYNHLFTSGESLPKIRDAALNDRLYPNHDGEIETPGRSIAWKLFLMPEEPLKNTLSPPSAQALLTSLRTERKRFTDELTEKMCAPDGSFAEGFTPPGTTTPPKQTKATNLEMNNPLSLHTDNPWTEWFATLDLRKTIFQDVERTFPEVGFFRQPEVQDQLTNILFLYSMTHKTTGYRQGMHELLAPIFYAVDFDSTAGQHLEDPVGREICSKTWIAADAWILFECMMKSVSVWYEWREASEATSNPNLPSPLSHHVNLNVQPGPVEIRPYIAPIVQACNRIQSSLLKSIDPLLWKHMQSAGIEPQIYGIRWLRLLFTREFNLPDALKLWDGLFACDPTFELAPWICVAMLIRIRNQLLPADYTGQLTVLLKYPLTRETNITHHTTVLLRQALALQMAPNPSTGASIVMENRNLLGIPIEVPEPEPAPTRRHRHAPQEKSSPHPGVGNHARQPSSPQPGFPEMFARGIVERGESLGINKTLMNAVTELRRNIPELASSFVRSPPATPMFPLENERSPTLERPPWEPKSRLQIEREIESLRSTNSRLGASLTWVVDTLLQDENESTNPNGLRRRKQSALETLSYVRDVLNGGVDHVDDDRLFTEEEMAKRKAASTREHNGASTKSSQHTPGSHGYFATMRAPKAPAPASVADFTTKSGFTKPRRPATPPLYPVSPPAATTPPETASPGVRMAPWNYTQSSFSSTLPSTSLPRLPPRTSQVIRPTPTPPSSAPVRAPDSNSPSKIREVKSPDPLGVLS